MSSTENSPITNSPKERDNTGHYSPWRFCVAPMMSWSDRHCRYLWRLMSKNALLYTEMVTTGALIHGDKKRFLQFNAEEHPIALQLGGCHPNDLALCAKMAEDWGYDEVNLNCGCPSDRVQEGKIGAILMNEPKLVAQCVDAMKQACSLPITVKHRIGVDDADDYSYMHDFVDTVKDAGCETFIVHARKAWLKGLSPKQNREIPPLRYELVDKLKQAYPQLTIVTNGGIKTIDECRSFLQSVDGVMVGREAYNSPYLLSSIDNDLFESNTDILSREEILHLYADYCARQMEAGERFHHISRHILGLYSGQFGGKAFRRFITERATLSSTSFQTLLDAQAYVKRPPGTLISHSKVKT